MKDLLNKADFARRAGVSGAAITNACEASLKLAFDGRYVDANHPAAIEYLERAEERNVEPPAPGLDSLYTEVLAACRDADKWSTYFIKNQFGVGSGRAKKLQEQVAAAKKHVKIPHVRGTAAAKAKRVSQDTGSLEELEPPEELAKYLDMTLMQITVKFGNAVRFKDYVSAVKDIGAIEERAIKTAKLKGVLVNRELVQIQIIESFDAAHIKMLRDGSRTIATRAAAMIGSGGTAQEVTEMVEDIISSFIKPVKAKIARAMLTKEADEDV